MIKPYRLTFQGCLITFGAVLLLVSCTPASQVYHQQLLAFGTLIDIKIWGVDKAKGDQAVREIEKDFQFMHRAWHAWHPGTLGRLNKLLPSGEKVSMAPSIIPLLTLSQKYSKQSGGRFNPAIGKLVRLWGFASDDPAKGPPPEEYKIDELLSQKPSMEDIVVDGIMVYSKNPAVSLDFGGFAKGYGVDKAIEHFRELGIHNAVINAGGDLRAIGRHGDRPWRVGIRNPRGDGYIGSLEVQGDESVFTSGDYERFFEHNGVKYHHIIDPRTGYPARGAISVTILHDNAALADAAATALMIAGPEDWYEVAKAMGLKHVMLVDTRGSIIVTPSMKQRLIMQTEAAQNVNESAPL